MNNEMLPTLFDQEASIETQDVDEFHYEVLDLEDREFVQEKEYEIRTHWTRAASEILASGEKLLLVQDRLKRANGGIHGNFEGWLKRVGLSKGNAFFAMKAYNRFGNEKKSVIQTFSSEVVRELTYASDEIVDQVVSGDVHPTVKAIREAKKAEKEAKEEAEEARKAVTKAKADARAAQQQLTLKEASFQSEFEALKGQFEAKIQKLEALTTPQIEIREIEKEVLPESVKNNIAEMQGKIDELQADLDKTKGTVPQETLDQMEMLQTQLATYKTLVDAKEKSLNEIRGHNAKIAEMNKKLSEEARLMSAETQAVVGRARIRQKWREDTKDLHVAIAKFVSEIPSLIDQESLEGDDWARQGQCIEILQRALSALGQMRNSQSDPFVNASVVDTALSVNGHDIVDAEVVQR